ncbi:MAG TPA: bifunctional DNA primase/polymerase [Nocardioidaceae bacterium]|nr:bifunctional DNA primase/polymerase [Nocardioidaceae bacterium]
MNHSLSAYEWALQFAAAGIAVFPVYWPDDGQCACGRPDCGNPAKHPLTSRGVKDATTELERIERWSRMWPLANWAAATDGYTVLDADSAEAHGAFADAEESAGFIVATGRGGGHHWFRGEHGKPGAKSLGSALDYDVRTGGGAYVLLPGSRHVNGRVYQLERGAIEEIGPAPAWVTWLSEGIRAGGRAHSLQRLRQQIADAPSGDHSGRNVWAASVFRSLARLLRGYRWLYDVAVRGAVACIVDQTGFPESEWWSVAERIWATDESNAERSDPAAERPARGQPSLSSVALEHLAARYQVYRSADDAELVVVARGGVIINSFDSVGLRQALASNVHATTGKVPNGSVLTDALNTFAGVNAGAPSRRVWTRVGVSDDDRLVLDLGDDDTGYAVVGSHGWEVASSAPVLFRRAGGALALPRPTSPGDVWAARSLFNCSDDDYRLLVAWLTASLFPDIAHPVLIVVGEPGSSKTSTTRRVVQTVDPHVAQDMAFPPQSSWIPAIRPSWVVGFDNVSRIEGWQSDALCRAVTGDGYRARRLYTNGDAVEYRIRRVITLNGMGPAGIRGDLADRSLHIELVRIEPSERKEDAELDRQWLEAWPTLLGGLLSLAADVLRLLPDARPKELSRLADFSRLLAAIDLATGWHTVEAFDLSRQHMTEAVLSSDPLAVALDEMLGEDLAVEWTPTELLLELARRIPDRQMPTAQTLPGRLRTIAPMLERTWGIQVVQRRTRSRRSIKLTRLSGVGSSQRDGRDDPELSPRHPEREGTTPAAETEPHQESTAKRGGVFISPEDRAKIRAHMGRVRS